MFCSNFSSSAYRNVALAEPTFSISSLYPAVAFPCLLLSMCVLGCLTSLGRIASTDSCCSPGKWMNECQRLHSVQAKDPSVDLLIGSDPVVSTIPNASFGSADLARSLCVLKRICNKLQALLHSEPYV